MTTVLQEEERTEVDNTWTDIGAEDTLFEDGECSGVVVDGVKIALFRVAGNVYALDDICTHGNACLSEGDMDGFEIECPLHAGAFDIRNGKALCAPLTRDTRSHPVCRRADRILIQVKSK